MAKPDKYLSLRGQTSKYGMVSSKYGIVFGLCEKVLARKKSASASEKVPKKCQHFMGGPNCVTKYITATNTRVLLQCHKIHHSSYRLYDAWQLQV